MATVTKEAGFPGDHRHPQQGSVPKVPLSQTIHDKHHRWTQLG